MWFMKKSAEDGEQAALPEKLRYSCYYEHDGALRAYANRAMLLAILSVPTAMIAVALAAYVRLQPPTLIRVDSTGAVQPAGSGGQARGLSSVNFQNGNEEPSDFEKKACARLFLERYLNFSPGSVNQNLAASLNMMTANLRHSVLAEMEKNNLVGRVADEQITSVFHLRSLEAEPEDGLRFTAFGVEEVHRLRDHQETTDRLVGEFHLRLITERRSEQNPSGLLVAEYGERLIEGERRNPADAALHSEERAAN